MIVMCVVYCHSHVSTKYNRRDDWKGLIMIKHLFIKNSAKETLKHYINYCSRKNPYWFQAYFYSFIIYHCVVNSMLHNDVDVSVTTRLQHCLCLVSINFYKTKDNLESKASPTLGCSIKISRDIYIYVSVVVQNAHAELHG